MDQNSSMLLVAEDDPDDQFLIQTVVAEVCPPETQMYFVEDGIKLLAYLNGRVGDLPKPRLIMLDLNMPLKDGREALKEIKSDPALADIPTVILTTSNIDEDVQYCSDFGIAGYYCKPATITELRDIMGELCAAFMV